MFRTDKYRVAFAGSCIFSIHVEQQVAVAFAAAGCNAVGGSGIKCCMKFGFLSRENQGAVGLSVRNKGQCYKLAAHTGNGVALSRSLLRKGEQCCKSEKGNYLFHNVVGVRLVDDEAADGSDFVGQLGTTARARVRVVLRNQYFVLF